MMSKYTNLLFKTLMIPILFFNFQMVFGNEKNINEKLENNKAKDWIEELKEEIKAIEQEDEGKDWIEELKKEIREADQIREVKDAIKSEKEKKKKV